MGRGMVWNSWLPFNENHLEIKAFLSLLLIFSALCREGGHQRSVCHRPGRVPEVQASGRLSSASSLLRCPPLHHGERCQGLWGGCVWQTQGSACQVHEVCGWFDDPQWRPSELLRRHSCASRPAPARCTWNQSKNYVAMGPKWKDWPQKASSRSCQHCGTQRRDLAHHPHFRAEGWQTRTASHAAASSHCLRGFTTSATRSLAVLKTSLNKITKDSVCGGAFFCKVYSGRAWIFGMEGISLHFFQLLLPFEVNLADPNLNRVGTRCWFLERCLESSDSCTAGFLWGFQEGNWFSNVQSSCNLSG